MRDEILHSDPETPVLEDEQQTSLSNLCRRALNYNPPASDRYGVIRITIAKVLMVGRGYYDPQIAIVEDFQGGLWIIPETPGEQFHKYSGLVSRYDVRENMQFLLNIDKKNVKQHFFTRAFCVVSEVSERRSS